MSGKIEEQIILVLRGGNPAGMDLISIFDSLPVDADVDEDELEEILGDMAGEGSITVSSQIGNESNYQLVER